MNDPVLEAYESAHYFIEDSEISLRFEIGKLCPELDLWLEKNGFNTAVFITAHNPHSQILTPLDNCQRQSKLVRELLSQGYCYLKGYSTDAEHIWPEEESLLVPNMDLSHALCLARKYQQKAVVWIEYQAEPELRVAVVETINNQ
ncbi:DUF3293 domain-containing protein [Aliikangiella sp. G2MR2-5]|uniref:DUF3293 domain-containing protein n=1 Tax=Aliikangiella sp. G2MR2-5 TaxID=2788943 RepID=UPI0018AA5CD6|nr:DUF3293 domain-containing protein [Aliikangiella sp. G2MR2-5]